MYTSWRIEVGMMKTRTWAVRKRELVKGDIDV